MSELQPSESARLSVIVAERCAIHSTNKVRVSKCIHALAFIAVFVVFWAAMYLFFGARMTLTPFSLVSIAAAVLFPLSIWLFVSELSTTLTKYRPLADSPFHLVEAQRLAARSTYASYVRNHVLRLNRDLVIGDYKAMQEAAKAQKEDEADLEFLDAKGELEDARVLATTIQDEGSQK